MDFFAMPYRVMFHDTMAYGSHHFLTNFKFQCVIREHLFFDKTVDVATPEGKKEFDKLILLTQQGYCRTMSPVRVGEKVAILLSVEELSISSVRFCFRVVRYDGVPVTCGFQTIVCVSSETGAIVSAPPFILKHITHMMEPLEFPSFADRILKGRTKEVFNDDIIALAVSIANSEPGMSYPRFVVYESPAEVSASPDVIPENFPGGTVFMFPGQGSYSHTALKDIYQADAESALFLQKADKITERFLGSSILDMVTAKTTQQHDALLNRSPDLTQVGIYIGSVLVARYLMKKGLNPNYIVGHSAGELAALAIAGVYSDEVGVEIMCNRILILQSMDNDPAGMLAVFCDEKRVRSVINEIGESSLQIAVVNHAEQTVISGISSDLHRLKWRLESLGIRSMVLKSRYPFHSTLMEPAVAQFTSFLETVRFTPPEIPIYSPINRGFYTVQSDIAHLLASHLIRPFSFPDSLLNLYDSGGRIYIECGGGSVLGKLVSRVLTNKDGLEVHSPLASGRETVNRLEALITPYTEVADAVQLRGWGSELDSARPDLREKGAEKLPVANVPVSIVSMGCVLPGAENRKEFWQNILKGKSGIFDASELRPDMAADFLSVGEVVPDKTYTLLGGFVRDFNPDINSLPYSEQDFSRLSSAQRYLAVAVNQCMKDYEGSIPTPDRIHVYLGSTGDGIVEYDEALLLAGLHHEVNKIASSPDSRELFHELLNKTLGRKKEEVYDFAPHEGYSAVVSKIIGGEPKVICVDAACASSLYAIDLGLNALIRGECDVALCGGVFAPGPANSCLFSQFRGLSENGSRPLDASADGVVFGEGAALLMLKRLPDTIDAGDRIHAVIRGSGLSNDGKSPSVAVPRRQGQIIALQRAYQETGIAPESVQYVEAHATATPVGDTEEFMALSKVFGQNEKSANKIDLGSVKALIGHTGWIAGAASIIKMVESLNTRTIPPQNNFTSPNPKFDIAGSPFTISNVAKPWRENDGTEPRRTGINGFGFGGSNAHVIMEEYVPEYHRRWEKTSVPAKKSKRVMSVVGIGTSFPFDTASMKDGDQPLQFDKKQFNLPKGFMILPDVADNMDKSQFLAFLTALDALDSAGDGWKSWKSDIGVVIGVKGKTGLSILTNKRIYADNIERRLNSTSSSSKLPEPESLRIRNELFTSLRNIQPSGPYTLPGLMPNVISGRIGNLLDLNGPNFVIDSGDFSLFESLSTAENLLSAGRARMVLAGGINGYAGPEVQPDHASGNDSNRSRPVAEGAVILALVNPEFARTQKLPVIAELEISGNQDVSSPGERIMAGEKSQYQLSGAEGSIEVSQAIKRVSSTQVSVEVQWPSGRDKHNRVIRIAAPMAKQKEDKDGSSSQRLTASDKIGPASPIYFCTPRLTESNMKPELKPYPIRKGRVLVITDQVSLLNERGTQETLNELEAAVLCTAGDNTANVITVDLSSDESIDESFRQVDFSRYDCIIAIKDLANTPPFDGVIDDAGTSAGLLDLMFAVVRQVYDRLKDNKIAFGSLCINAAAGEHLHPYSGLLSGFVKAIARELPRALCKAVTTDTPSVRYALTQMEAEWGAGPLPAPAEIIYKDSIRHEYSLQRLDSLSSGNEQSLDADSVVIATGGARGVTAVLVEELLRSYGCTVILLGRTDLSDIPNNILSMPPDEFDAHETTYYREEMKSSTVAHISDLKRRYEHFRNIREIKHTLSVFNSLSGNVEYMSVDITDRAAVDSAIQKVAAKFGNINLVIHGAGLQISKNTARKKMGEFRRIVATKIGGLGNLHRSYRKHFPGARAHFHLITSVFSYFGNDGQPDYGAANEAMNHIANWMGASDTKSEWTSLAWLGWAGIGMTRGSEYEALALSRGLRPVTREEGQAIFSDIFHGSPLARANLLISEGEIKFYGVKLLSSDPAASPDTLGPTKNIHDVSRQVGEVSWDLSMSSLPYISDHVVGGRPTYPGSFEFELAAQAVHSLRPDLQIVFFEDTNLTKFIRLPSHSGSVTCRGRVKVMGESRGNTLVRVQLLSDFIHSSGKILQKDMLHFETTLHMSSEPRTIEKMNWNGVVSDILVPDPYLLPNTFVQLRGFFDCLGNIKIGVDRRKGRFRIKETDMLSMISHYHTPSVMMDAIFRFSMINITAEGLMPIYVPIGCREIYVASNINDTVLAAQGDEIDFFGTNPVIEGEMIRSPWIQACDREGRILLLTKDLTALKVGEVPVGRFKSA